MKLSNKIKSTIIFVATFVIASTTFDCRRDAGKGKDKPFRYALETEPKTIDWNVNDESVGIEIAYHLCEPLVWYDQKTLIPLPGAAESWKQENLSDGTVKITFTIGQDRKWTNGDPVTARDFHYAWSRLVDPKTGAKYQRLPKLFGLIGADAYFAAEQPINSLHSQIEKKQNMLDEASGNAELVKRMTQEVEDLRRQKSEKMEELEPQLTRLSGELGFKAENERTFAVRVKSSGYADIFMELAGFAPLCPLHQPTILKHKMKWTNPENIVGNGPYKLIEHVKDGYFLLQKRQDWWNAGNVAIDRVFLETGSKWEVTLQRYEESDPQKTLHMTQTVSPDWIKQWRNKPDLRISPIYGVYYVIFQTQKSPFNDERVRRALCKAIDRQHIVEFVTQGDQRPISAFFPGLPNGKYTEITGLEFNPEQAREELRKAGYTVNVENDKVVTRGFPSITYMYNTNPGHEAVATALQEMWREQLGISVQLSSSSWKAFTEKRERGECQVCRGGWIGDFLHPLTMADILLKTSSQNDSRWVAPEYDKLIGEAMEASDSEQVTKLFQEADAMIAQEAPVCPLYQYNTVRLVKPNVGGYVDNLRDYHPTWQLSLTAPK